MDQAKLEKAVVRAAMKWWRSWSVLNPPHHISQRRDYLLYQACARLAKKRKP